MMDSISTKKEAAPKGGFRLSFWFGVY